MREFMTIAIVPILLTLGAYQAGLALQKKLKSPICNPILISVVLILLFMAMTGYQNGDYQAGCAKISWLMTPATVCLAIPMYEQLRTLGRNFRAIAAGVAAGTAACLAMVLLFAALAGFDRSLTASLLPKSVTSAIGVPLSEMAGGMGSVTTAAIILTGIFANMLSLPLLRLFRLTDPVAQGVALGTAGHVIATTKANELSQLTGAVSSLSLVVAGLMTAAVFPWLAGLL